MQSAKERSPTDMRNGSWVGEMERTLSGVSGINLVFPELPEEWENMLHAESRKKTHGKQQSSVFVCLWRGRQKKIINVSAHSELTVCPCDAAIACSLKKVCRVYRRPSLWTVFLFICRFQRPTTVPLINLPREKKNTPFQPSAGCRGISQQSMHWASVKGSSSRPPWRGRRWESRYESYNSSCAGCREQRESSIFLLQQPSIAPRLSPTVPLHDCSCYRMVRWLSGETKAYPDQWAHVQTV